MNSQSGDLLHRLKLLEEENLCLRQNIIRLENDIRINDSLRAESVIARLTGGVLSANNDNHDVLVPQTMIRLEVKFSSINIADKRHTNPTARWAWHKVFGSGGNKKYDRLILIGERDKRFSGHYKSSEHPVIVFDVPYKDVDGLSILTKSYKQEMKSIQLVTNPLSTSSTASRLFTEYQSTLEVIEATYRGYCQVLD